MGRAAASAAADSARFAIAPLAMAVEAAELEAFARGAKPGAMLVYAMGVAPPRSAEAWKLAGQLAAKDALILTSRVAGDGRGTEWVAVKPGTPPRAPICEPAKPRGEALRVLVAIAARAAAGECCQTNAELAAECELTNADRARYLLRVLERTGHLSVEHGDRRERRIVWIAATGQRTVAGPL